jgi:hypothetical protein
MTIDNIHIKDVVAQFPLFLSYQLNKGNRNKISSGKINRGSLWIQPQKHKYYVVVTGAMESYLYHFLQNKFGVHHGEDQGKKYWHIIKLQDVESIIQYLGSTLSAS